MWLIGRVLMFVNLLVHPILLFYPVWLLGLLVPIPAWRRFIDGVLVDVSMSWTVWNTRIIERLGGTRFAAEFAPGIALRRDKRYLVISNHSSFVDIFALQGIFHPRTPFLTFFLKRELLYFPVFGPIWWKLGFPYMRRHSPAFLAQHPEKKGEDLRTTKKFCERIRGKPYAIVNFVEGTRRTSKKAKGSSYRHLLPPKAGGIATALAALDYEFDHVLDVSLVYPRLDLGFWDMLSPRIGTVRCVVREIPLSDIPRGDYFGDPAFAERFRAWLNDYWTAKDRQLDALHAPSTPAAPLPPPPERTDASSSADRTA